MTLTLRLLVAVTAMVVLTATPAASSSAVTLEGSFSTVVTKPNFEAFCPSHVADECGTIQLVGLGAADWAYVFGPTFQPNGRCFDVDGTFSLRLQSDGSTVSGPLSGLFCPDPSATGHRHGGPESFGNPFSEDDIIVLAGGTGQFNGHSGNATFHTQSAGAVFKGTLNCTLVN